MKVLIVNTSDNAGGAAVAARHLMEALCRHGVEAKMLVRDLSPLSSHPSPLTPAVIAVPRRWWAMRHFLWERLLLFVHLHFRRTNLFAIDMANSGIDITRLPQFREADVIHLHWINQGMLSLSGIRKILHSGKPVVWTMHDMWPATSICHLTLGCRQFTKQCQRCPYLTSHLSPPTSHLSPLTSRVWRRKQRMLSAGEITFVACSRWLEGEAKASRLLRGQHIVSIPNPIDTSLWCPGDRMEARRQESLPESGRVILFVCQRVTNKYKGMDYLIEACRLLADSHPEMKDDTTVVILGSHADEVSHQLPFPCVAPGYVTDEQRMVRIYRSADVFVLPSLSENLPNTIMEAMACGVPCLAFRVGGIPEEIDHRRTGYVARYRDAADLAGGLRWILTEADWQSLSSQCVSKVQKEFSQSTVALRYTEIYQHAIVRKNLNL